MVERVQEKRECWKPAFARYLIPKYTGLRLDLDRYLNYYNTDRAHTGRWTPQPVNRELIEPLYELQGVGWSKEGIA